MEQRQREDLFGSGARGSRFDEDESREDDIFLGGHQRHATHEERMQDEHLDAIGVTLARVGQMAEGFHTELQAQNHILDGMGSDIEQTNHAMKTVEGKTAELVEKAGGPGWFCLIATLSGIALFLFILIIYT